MVRAKDRPLSVQPIRPAYQQVADRIRAAILSGRISPGERLPVEMELTQMFGVSRSTVREALRTLASQNLVVTTRGVTGGTYVAHPNPEHISRYLEASLGLLSDVDEVGVDELMEARRLLEIPAVRSAAADPSAALVEALAATVSGTDAEVSSYDFEGNRQFHVLILEASRNRLLELMARPIWSVLRTRFSRQEASRGFWRRVNEDHTAIVAAVKEGDPDQAEALMDRHLSHLRTTYVKIDRARKRA